MSINLSLPLSRSPPIVVLFIKYLFKQVEFKEKAKCQMQVQQA